MICRFFDNCINECYIVGDGSLCPSRRGLLGLLAQTSKSRPVTTALSIYKARFILFKPSSLRKGDRNAVEGVY